MNRYSTVAAVVLLATIVGCNSSTRSPSPRPTFPGATIANGKSIFQTGKDSGGVQIAAHPPALKPRCAACHGAAGSGGVHLPGGAVSADLRHKALVTDQRPPYTLALLERAISTGVDNQGQRLNRVMPRWKLSKRDLHDVAEYVLTQLR
ncbi:MAG TPA: c-type cytochrome [Candidatus Baltobacteraceae bacterium]|nr:c-type cytochrome [Candidatus Baltobacteraceae bacterium]